MERRFANGELIALVGEAVRAGNHTPTAIVRYTTAASGLDPNDRKLAARLMFSMKDCLKRRNANGA
ncbi:MAG: hypothetical protein GC155_13545 [Alphaproteobacteria bacterium]|nr:hypothetical protein [Alphaproteobacteria bacterium]